MTTEPDERPAATQIRAVAVLDDLLRRGMYEFARRSRRPVTRDEAAEAVGISRKLAAFHLDKLVEAGLLRAHYGMQGAVRKVGRRPKVYEPADAEIQVSIPPRRHEVLAEILMDAVLAERPGENARSSALRVAEQHGKTLGEAEREQRRPGRLGAERALALAQEVLRQQGFEPCRVAATRIRLANCPFHPLAAREPDLVCGLNHAFLTGFLEGLGTTSVRAELAPAAGECCVQLETKRP